MKYYKIVNHEGHHGIKYHEGLNTDPLPFNPSGDCVRGGIYFAREDIFYFLNYGTELYEVEPVGEVYENPSNPQKWKAHEVNLKHIGNVLDLNNIKLLVEQGADIHADDKGDDLLFIAISGGNLDIVKYLVEQGANIHADDGCALPWAAKNGHLDIVKYLAKNGADIHSFNDSAFQNAAYRGYLDMVKYLVEKGCDIHVNNDFALRLAAEGGNLDVVKYLFKHGAKLSKIDKDDWRFRIKCYLYCFFNIKL